MPRRGAKGPSQVTTVAPRASARARYIASYIVKFWRTSPSMGKQIEVAVSNHSEQTRVGSSVYDLRRVDVLVRPIKPDALLSVPSGVWSRSSVIAEASTTIMPIRALVE